MGLSRRSFFESTAGGFAGLAIGQMIGAVAASGSMIHHRPKAKRVIQLFMNGGVSQMDTFDHKPVLGELNGEKFDPGDGRLVESVTNSPGFKVLKSPFQFRQHGECGRWVSDVLPHMASIVDELAFLMSMNSPTNVHGLGSYMQNTGFTLPGFPCMGAWISHALGRINQNLPEFIVLPDPNGLPYNNLGNFTSGFLPARHQGTVIDASNEQPVRYLFPPGEAKHINDASEATSRDVLRLLNERHLKRTPGDSRLEARIQSLEMAARMQLSVPELFDLKDESQAVRRLYGADEKVTGDFAKRCILGRRMLERGVRFVQIWSGAGGPRNNWDNHANIHTELPNMTRQVDQPITGLIKDLKALGMLEDTLVIWTTEFGRMPFSQGQAGRDHNGGTFVTWFAGGGTKGGSTYGESDQWGWKSNTGTTSHDMFATILHLLGIDHEKLTVRHNGIDRRITDVHGHVVQDILV
ncbi:MAG TPA: DUF1501 domain-containing protein [Verrucomicrobiales bacterium]|nr:DUF1501 domain-containing protein [Verrucomicrobiales bacterium]|tara:strand:- start:1116 stop:2513 length:1398 start_codon:yes stop_codon:yes gene_type:complete